MKRIFSAAAVAVAIISGVAAVSYFWLQYIGSGGDAGIQQGVFSVAQQDSVRSDFGAALPEGFPSEMLLGEKDGIVQGYDVAYPDRRQSTVVFRSGRTSEENLSSYTEFFSENGWAVSNQFSGNGVSALYAMKAGLEANVTAYQSDAYGSKVIVALIVPGVLSVDPISVAGSDSAARSQETLLKLVKERPEFKDVLTPGVVVPSETMDAFIAEIRKSSPQFAEALSGAVAAGSGSGGAEDKQ